MFSRVAFWDLIISVHSIVQSLCRLAGPCVDGTAWMAFYYLNMYIFFFLCLFRTHFFFERLSIALELAKHNPVYASKFFEVSKRCVDIALLSNIFSP